MQRELFAGDEWIADGNYSATLDERLPRADTVVFCDFPAWRTLPRVLRRTLFNLGGRYRPKDVPSASTRSSSGGCCGTAPAAGRE